jgi:hypothetical protein
MANDTAVALQTSSLTQAERVADTFLAPSKTFTDILRSANWLVPFLLLVAVSVAVSFTVGKKVGYDRVAENSLQQNPRQLDQISQLTPEQRARQMGIAAAINRGISYGFPVMILIFSLLQALLLWASFNFGLGAETKYNQVLAVGMYAALPKLLIGVLTIATLLFGNDQESFNIQNAVGTNPGFYLPDAALWLKSLLSWFDVLGLWSLALLVLGMAIIARKSVAQSAAVVVGWWLLGLLLSVGATAAFS